MTQQNIDFGSFPNDPDADAIRTAFQKTQENFTELYQNQANANVITINNGQGITVTSSSGNYLITANLSSLQVKTTTLKVGQSANLSGNAIIINNAIQTLWIDLQDNISLTGNISANNISSNNLTVANFSLNSVNLNISATGTDQNTATLLTKQINVISSGANANGVKLPNAIGGMSVIIVNTTANNIYIYPNSGASIEGYSVNIPIKQINSSTLQIIAVSNTKWYRIGLNYDEP